MLEHSFKPDPLTFKHITANLLPKVQLLFKLTFRGDSAFNKHDDFLQDY